MSCPDKHIPCSSEVHREGGSEVIGMREKGYGRSPRPVREAEGRRRRLIRTRRRLVEKVRK